MPPILNKTVFEPSNGALNEWLATRKPQFNFNGDVPGFFSDAGEDSDSAWFWGGGVVGEVMGFLALSAGGLINGGVYLLLALFGAIGFVFLDGFLALKLHRREGRRCKLRTQIYIEEDEATKADLKHELSCGRGTDFFIKAAIFFIAVLKIVAILVLGVFTAIILYIPFLVIYSIVAYVHTNHTGYWWAYRKTARHFKKDHDEIKSHPAQTRSATVPLKAPLQGVPLKHTPHDINRTEAKNPAEDYEYTITAKGVLTDEDIQNLILQHAQTQENQAVVFKACRRLQLQSLPTN